GLGGLGVFETADGGWVYLSAWNDKQFKTLCELADLAYLGESPEYATRLQRSIHGAEVNELLGQWISTMQLDDVVELLARHKVPAAPMRMSVEELFDDPQVVGNEMYKAVEHPTKGRLWQLRGMLEVDGDHGRMDPAPLFGEHTDEVLTELGYSGEEVSALREAGAVA
ncbi:MAG: CoA transferase, partial [Chloroflexi bacterium]|nr:CoA transferase [Chloroflexota bacterium]